MRAFCYIRVSTGRQELSPEVQRAQVSAYCAMKGFEIAGVFEETGVSGSVRMENRPRGCEMLSRLGEVDAMVFSKLDRAFRDTVDCILTVDRIRKAGLSVHFLDLGVDTSTPAGQLCLEMMAAFAKFERGRISDRITECLAQAKRQGKKIGPAPLGYRNLATFVDGKKVNGGLHVEEPAERLIVERMRALAVRGCSYAEVARRLNAEGARTRQGKAFTHTQVRRAIGGAA